MRNKNNPLTTICILLAVLSSFLFAACSRSSNQVFDEEVVAFVNNHPITGTALEQEMRSMQFMFELRANQDSIDEFLQHAGRDWSQISQEERYT